jgi:predicted deacylase
VLGRHHGGRPGPTIVAFGAIHGNEPAGALAIERVFARIDGERLPVRGRLIGLSGNLRALGERRRFLDRDLNRRWTAENIARLVNAGGDEASEDGETLALLAEIVPLLRAAGGPVVFLDLHSTSGPARPFSCMADVLRNRRIALALPIPVVLGLEEVIDGSMLGYFCDLGHVGVAVEGGQHDDPATVDGLESALLLTLVAAGALAPDELRDMSQHRARLLARSAGLPSVCEIRHRHVVGAGDEPFTMAPGWENFQPVRKGQVVARDRAGEVRAPHDGLMMLPRYQGQGDDGFFVAGVVSRMALTASAVLRSLQLDRLIPYLPGVARHPEREDHYIADPEVARVGVAQVFHLFGYRHVRAHERSLVFSRRSPAQGKTPRLPAELMPLALRAADV